MLRLCLQLRHWKSPFFSDSSTLGTRTFSKEMDRKTKRRPLLFSEEHWSRDRSSDIRFHDQSL
jgi:hypothetical protein